MSNLAAEYIIARRVLLDALVALEGHLDNLILVGAQAVYHHAGEADLNVPLMTTDGDLAVNTRDLAEVPEIGAALRGAGFTPGPNPGHWVAISDVAVDLMGSAAPGRNDEGLGPGGPLGSPREAHSTHSPWSRTRTHRQRDVNVAALEPGDTRTFHLRVAGPAALLTAKAIKISERLEQADTQPDRLKQKDALDAFRVLQAIETQDLVRGISKHQEDEHAAAVTAEAIEVYRAHASTAEARIAQLAADATQGDPTVPPAFASLVRDLLSAL